MGEGEILYEAELAWFVGFGNYGQGGSLERAYGSFEFHFGEGA
jgi:hypothetical protein